MLVELPIELWRDILSYLPNGTASRLIGVNRQLFEIGMNELYEEVSVGASPCKYFEWKRFENCVVEQLKNAEKHFSSTVLSATMKKLFRVDNGEPVSRLLALIVERLKACQNLKEITLQSTAGNQGITKLYAQTIGDLLAEPPLAQQIRVLNVDIHVPLWKVETPKGFHSKLPFSSILPSTVSTHLTLLTTLNLVLSASRARDDDIAGGDDEDYGCKALAEHLRAVLIAARHTLTSLVVVLKNGQAELPVDLADLFPAPQVAENTGREQIELPALKTVSITSQSYGLNVDCSEIMVQFLTHCAIHIESLTLMHGLGFGRVPRFFEEEKLFRLAKFLEVMLKTGRCMASLRELTFSLSISSVKPLVAVLEAGLMPELRKLVLSPPMQVDGLTFDMFKEVLESIVHGGGASKLEEIHVYVCPFSPSHLVLLQEYLPKLRKLVLVYDRLAEAPDSSSQGDAEAILTAFQTSAHPDWKSRTIVFEEMEFDTRFEGNPGAVLRKRIQRSQ
ncbi:hypothetical protein AN958_02149 [Leucoagaricus sp. SymC.cos]|nr:hypothetical protein AN958_02149 [Leucoagaricus sp. SymC.cos]